MSDCCDIPTHICQFPNELIIHILKFLSGKTLITCRRVCKRWKEVIEDVACDEILWEDHCKREFKDLYEDAKFKSYSCRLWFEVYRSLSLWNRVQYAAEARYDFAHSYTSKSPIEDMFMLKNGILSLNTYSAIDYYDMSTLELSGREPVKGDYTKYHEYPGFLIVHDSRQCLSILKMGKEADDSTSERKPEKFFYRQVRFFVIFNKIIYFVHLNHNIYYCNLEDLKVDIKEPPPNNEVSIGLGMYNGFLHVLTTVRNVYKYEKYTGELVFNADSKKDNIFDFLWRYQFIENIDWRFFHLWVANLRFIIPESPVKYVCMVKVYGDVFFVGNKSGTLMIYYKPYVDGCLDFFYHKPVKQYHFGKGDFLPMLSLYPILKVEVVEIKEGHRVVIAMAKKVITLTYTHNFKEGESKEIVPHIPYVPESLPL